MKIEDQVVSLELSKRLKELGVKQESIFAWHESELAGNQVVMLRAESKTAQQFGEWVSAFTVAELGEMLGPEVQFKKYRGPKGLEWGCLTLVADGPRKKIRTHAVWDGEEANSRAKMLIYCIEHDWVKP